MLDPQVETVRFALLALVIGVVIFGGTTLSYLVGNRRTTSPSSVPAQRLHERSKAGESLDAQRDQAA